MDWSSLVDIRLVCQTISGTNHLQLNEHTDEIVVLELLFQLGWQRSDILKAHYELSRYKHAYERKSGF